MGEIPVIKESRKKWIQYDEDTEVLIQYIPKPEMKTLSRVAQKIAAQTGGSYEGILLSRVAPIAVCGWRKIGAPEHPGLISNGEPLPFNEENLKFLMTYSYEFSSFVQLKAVDTQEFVEDAERKSETKNGLQPISGA